MAFKKYTAEVILTTELPKEHSINYTDFNIYRKFDEVSEKYILDDDKFINYFNEPFSDEKNLLKRELSGDNIVIQSGNGIFDLRFHRDWFCEVDFNIYKYAKVKLFFDETKSEEFYCWINTILLDNNQLVYINMNLVIDLIPTNYFQIKKQLYSTVITRRSFDVFKSNLSYLKEQEKRLERFSWNISCDDLCKSEHYISRIIPIDHERYIENNPNEPGRKRWGDKKEIRGMFIWDSVLNKENAKYGYNFSNLEQFTDILNNDFLKSLQPASIPQPPIFQINLSKIDIPIMERPGYLTLIDGTYLNFDNYLILRNYVYQYLRGKRLLEVLGNGKEVNPKPENIITMFLYPYNKIEKKKERSFKALASPEDYNFYKDIPLHYKQLHTKYTIIGNQDEVGEIKSDFVFLNGYNYLDSINLGKWVECVPLKIFPRITTQNVVLDIYATNWIKASFHNKETPTLTWDITPILSLDFWVKIYAEVSALEKYLRSNEEQRKLQMQQARNTYIFGIIGSALAGAAVGASTGSKFGPYGIGIGITIGAVIGIAGYFFKEHVLGIRPEDAEKAKQKDLQNSFSPSIPSILGGNYIFGNTPQLNNYHVLGIGLLIVSGYGWENNISQETDKIDSQRMLNNLINFGEKCQKYFKEFNFLEFVANNKTDKDVFYIVGEQSRPKNSIKWSNIISDLPLIFASLMETGLRFHFKD